jgi:hypothetical protein
MILLNGWRSISASVLNSSAALVPDESCEPGIAWTLMAVVPLVSASEEANSITAHWTFAGRHEHVTPAACPKATPAGMVNVPGPDATDAAVTETVSVLAPS